MSKSYFRLNRHNHTARSHTNGYNDIIPLGIYNQVPAFNPLILSVPCVTWFKGDAGLTKVGTTPLSWVNYGTNGGTATFSNPCIVVQINGMDAVRMPDEQHYAQFTLNMTSIPRSVFAVFKFANVTIGFAPYTFLSQEHNTRTKDWQVGLYTNFFPYLYSWLSFSYNYDFMILSGFNTPSPAGVLYTMGLTNASSSANNLLTINGVTRSLNQYNQGSGSAYLTGSYTTYLGSNTLTAPSDYDMTIAEILIFDGAVTSAESATITSYLRTKWGTA